jgi:hypothetical protein
MNLWLRLKVGRAVHASDSGKSLLKIIAVLESG